MARRPPDPRLSSLVVELCGYEEQARDQVTVERHIPATSIVPVILSFGDTIEVDMAGRTGDRFRSFVAGVHPGRAATRYQGSQMGVQIDLTPLGAHTVFGLPGAALAHRVVDLADVAPGLGGPSLQDRLASLPTWPRRLALVEQVVASLAAAGPRPDPMVRWLWHQISVSQGRARIADLVAETGHSHRHVTTRFRQQVGLTPKALAGVVRFEHAAEAVSTGHASLADVASTCGYADQSHLNREFVRLAGSPPGAFVRASFDPTPAVAG
jgi:AraC-like DNA-binding protein